VSCGHLILIFISSFVLRAGRCRVRDGERKERKYEPSVDVGLGEQADVRPVRGAAVRLAGHLISD